MIHVLQEAIAPALLAVPAVLNAASKWFSGNSQEKEAKRILAQNKRPDYVIPNALKSNFAQAEYNAASKRMPGQSVMEGNVASGVGRAVGGAIDSQRDPASIAAVLAATQANANKSNQQIGLMGANYQDNQMQKLFGVRNQYAGQELAEWDWNKKQKYLSAMAAASALQNAGGLNKAGAFNDVANLSTAVMFQQMGKSDGAMPQSPSSASGTPAANSNAASNAAWSSYKVPTNPNYAPQTEGGAPVDVQFKQNQYNKLIQRGYTPEQAKQFLGIN